MKLFRIFVAKVLNDALESRGVKMINCADHAEKLSLHEDSSSVFMAQELKEQIQSHKAQIQGLVLQTLGSIETVRRFTAEQVELRRYNAALDQLTSLNKQSRIYSFTFTFVRRVSASTPV